ncbi:MAG: hypothetical protein EON54_10675 [Alcaligenaceae bacterium]|nr:MAG: hypothetical protein EON54_10675 [Alcaligenaceae bacterium]
MNSLVAPQIDDAAQLHRRIMQLAARIEELTYERDRLSVENRRLTVDLDDALDREQIHALDPTQERLVVLTTGYMAHDVSVRQCRGRTRGQRARWAE